MSNKNPRLEVVVGVAAPLGSDKSKFRTMLEECLKGHDITLVPIKVTEELIKIDNACDIPVSFKYYIKMQICSELRDDQSKGILLKSIITAIKNKREKYRNKVVVYLVDQLKNVDEYEVLSFIYGLNYIQVSLYSSERCRKERIDNLLENDISAAYYDQNELEEFVKKHVKLYGNDITNAIKSDKIQKWTEDYIKQIRSNASVKLMNKDFQDNDYKDSGQQISKLFHRSHYFINLDFERSKLNDQIQKFSNFLTGKNQECPTQEEFGMCIAYQASVRSNFPNDTHIGAAIITENGEVVSVGSIRAPSKSANTSLADKDRISNGYWKYKEKLKNWKKYLEKAINCESDSQSKLALNELAIFISGSLDFHPCTHAEIAAILDAAKLGVSVYGCTLYTTTYPCHLCAKDIISAGIKKVVYLEAYPKSKNKELYPDNISSESDHSDGKITFDFYCGVGPKRFYYVYSLENKEEPGNPIPMLKYERPEYNNAKEEAVMNCLKNIEDSKNCEKNDAICKLLSHKR